MAYGNITALNHISRDDHRGSDTGSPTNVIPFRPRSDPGATYQARETVAPASDTALMRIVLVEWRITKGDEEQFLDYWSRRQPISDRSGLIGEFLSRIESPEQYPWITWELDERWTTFVNVGLWREAADFEEQIGRHLDDTRPPMAFEAERRRRILVAPERWRLGGTCLPTCAHREVY